MLVSHKRTRGAIVSNHPIAAWVIVWVMTFSIMPGAKAQEADEPAEQVDADVTAARPTPPPGDEMMRPTTRGLRITPRLAEGLGKQFVRFRLGDHVSGLTDDQRAKMAEAVARRTLDLQAKYRGRGRDGLESILELMAGDRKVTPEAGRSIGEKAATGLPILNEFYDGVAEDARSILDDSQMQEMNDVLQESRDRIKAFQNRMNRWARGEAKDGEDLFDRTDEDEQGNPGKKAKSREMGQVERRAESALRDVTPDKWAEFLTRARSVFEFTAEQSAAGSKLLAEYREKARAITTKEWREKARENRMKRFSDRVVKDIPLAPWLYRLDREYNQQMEPLKQMGREFRLKVVELATGEQRHSALTQLREFGERYGVSAEEFDALERKMPATQPAGQ